MTIALAIKVNDGVVLASDSATSIGFTKTPDGTVIATNVYNNANKIFNLRKRTPIAAMTWGLGNIGSVSTSTLAKDLRLRLGTDGDTLALKPDYNMLDLAEQVKDFYWTGRYESLTNKMELGLLVAGYATGVGTPELYLITMGPDGCSGPTPLFPGQDAAGAQAWGQPEAFSRIMIGLSMAVPAALVNLGLPSTDAQAYTEKIKADINVQLVHPAMPIQDAIDLAEFLAQTTIGFVRFSPGSPTVGGPIEIATISKHEGFKWVKRKHFFDRDLNPDGC